MIYYSILFSCFIKYVVDTIFFYLMYLYYITPFFTVSYCIILYMIDIGSSKVIQIHPQWPGPSLDVRMFSFTCGCLVIVSQPVPGLDGWVGGNASTSAGRVGQWQFWLRPRFAVSTRNAFGPCWPMPPFSAQSFWHTLWPDAWVRRSADKALNWACLRHHGLWWICGSLAWWQNILHFFQRCISWMSVSLFSYEHAAFTSDFIDFHAGIVSLRTLYTALFAEPTWGRSPD